MKYIHVKVRAGAGKEELKQVNNDYFLISVREKAERNLANRRVMEILSSRFKLPISRIRIVNGHRSPSKLLVLDNGKEV